MNTRGRAHQMTTYKWFNNTFVRKKNTHTNKETANLLLKKKAEQ